MAELAGTRTLLTAMPARSPTADADKRLAVTIRNLLLYGVLLYLFASGVPNLFSGATESDLVADASSDAGNLYVQLLLPAFFFTACILVYAHRVPVRVLWAAMIPIGPMLLLMMFSTVWSEYPALTIRRASHEVIELATFALLASCFSSANEILKICFRAFLAMACLDLLSAAAFPEAITSIGFAGIHGHKNIAGQFFVVALPVFLFGTLYRQLSGSKLIGLFALLSCIAMLILTESKTSIGAALVGSASVLVARGLSHREAPVRISWLLICALGLLCAIAAVLIWTLDELLEILIGDPTLTGRDGIWQYAIRKFDDSPIVGTGYGAIWQVGPAIQSSLKEMGIWLVFNEAHDGYLEIAAQLGIVGILCLLIFLVTTLMNALSYWDTIESHRLCGAGALAIYIFWGLLLSNVTESLYFQGGAGYPAMLVFLAAFVATRLALRSRAASQYRFAVPANRRMGRESPPKRFGRVSPEG